MINLSVDEGYAFDYLSILEVKKNLHPSESKTRAYQDCVDFLKNQLSHQIFSEVSTSKEYSDLYKSNKKTFELVDLARNNGQVTAKEVDDANMERFFYKQKFQKRFFGNILTEEKVL